MTPLWRRHELDITYHGLIIAGMCGLVARDSSQLRFRYGFLVTGAQISHPINATEDEISHWVPHVNKDYVLRRKFEAFESHMVPIHDLHSFSLVSLHP